jgi:cystathionine beta-lyase family protein involved in aluminum resistance
MSPSSDASRPSSGDSSRLLETILGDRKVDARVREAAERALPRLADVDDRRPAIRMRVLEAFLAEGIAESDLAGSTGYGYDDAARDRYESLLGRVFRAERVLARLSIVSGTHAIVAALEALCATGELLLCANGAPYDTLRFALVDAPFAAVTRGVDYAEVPRAPSGDTDLAALAAALQARAPAVVFVQRSRGYATRRSLSIDAIAALVGTVRAHAPEAVVLVDNCYGELVEEREPLEVGADLIAGSLIKNVGGGLAPTGGYVAGRADLVERVAARIFVPGLGGGLGPMLNVGRTLIQGLFYAPLVVGEALRGLDFAASLFAVLGFGVDPLPGERRTDIVQAIRLGSAERLIAFTRGLQRALPVNARFAPEPGPVPGYVDPVIMSGGAFVSGSTIDLSCDAPLREPYEVYLQGGVVAEHAALGAILAADALYASG